MNIMYNMVSEAAFLLSLFTACTVFPVAGKGPCPAVKRFYLKSPSIFPSSTRKYQQLNLDYSAVSQEEDGLTMPALKHSCLSYLSTGLMCTVKIMQFKEYIKSAQWKEYSLRCIV